MTTKIIHVLWLDDMRNPFTKEWMSYIAKHVIIDPTDWNTQFDVVWVKSYSEFVSYITEKGLPMYVFFDNDLGDVDNDLEGYDCAKWLVEYCMNLNRRVPTFAVQSDNVPAVENITALLNNYNNSVTNC